MTTIEEALATGTFRASHVIGRCYLLHFNPPYHHARHYLGWTSLTVEERLEQHLNGKKGSGLVFAAHKAGHEIVVAHVWEDVDRFFERKLKNSKNVPRFCPVCIAAEAEMERQARAFHAHRYADALEAIKRARAELDARKAA